MASDRPRLGSKNEPGKAAVLYNYVAAALPFPLSRNGLICLYISIYLVILAAMYTYISHTVLSVFAVSLSVRRPRRDYIQHVPQPSHSRFEIRKLSDCGGIKRAVRDMGLDARMDLRCEIIEVYVHFSLTMTANTYLIARLIQC